MIDYTQTLIEALRDGYRFIEERPWAKYPEYITLKDTETRKWFAAFLRTSGKNLGLSTADIIPLVNVKADPEAVGLITKADGILPAYHMNKKHWISIRLDGTVEIENILPLIESSYRIVTDSPTKRIYEAVRRIPKGKVATYGQVAAMAGNPRMSRAVGNALHKNPDGEATPCYRVVNAKGELADAFVFGGRHVQKERLEADGIEVIDGKVDLARYGYVCDPSMFH